MTTKADLTGKKQGRRGPNLADAEQLRQLLFSMVVGIAATRSELLRVVGVASERCDAPVQIDGGRRAFTTMTSAAERPQMPVADAIGGEGV